MHLECGVSCKRADAGIWKGSSNKDPSATLFVMKRENVFQHTQESTLSCYGRQPFQKEGARVRGVVCVRKRFSGFYRFKRCKGFNGGGAAYNNEKCRGA